MKSPFSLVKQHGKMKKTRVSMATVRRKGSLWGNQADLSLSAGRDDV